MSRDVLDVAFPAIIAIWFAWMIYSVVRGKSSRKAAEDNTSAVRENSELLRELIAIERKLLDNQGRPEA